ncbi:MAG: FkbM family methyltransferase [Oscillospiraceae bacterium]|nr:FkbM family methyltransferase [Oscillospiraceae bacterium]
MGSTFSDDGNGDLTDVKKLDDILKDEKPTLIKMDIEGAELDTLIGAENTIRKYKPKLAVCIYHKIEDIITIPKYLHSLVPEYKFRVRQHSCSMLETVLYAEI